MIPWTDLPQIFIKELERATGMFLAWFSDPKFNGSTFVSNISNLGKIDQVRVNGGSNYEFSCTNTKIYNFIT